MQVRVFYHDKCFDGACSASLFTRFHRECIDSQASYEYHGLVHRAGALFDEGEFTGDENAIVDFKYSASPKITWWFDHHLSAFLTPQDHENFLACQRDPVCSARKFFDPEYTSCTSFLAHIGSTRFGFDTAPVADLIHWANIVDGALYDSPEAAVEMAALVHDIGKLSIPAEILSMPRKLSPLEFSLIQEHPLKGYEILKDIDFPWPIAEIVLLHHERLDGSGYPAGLRGDVLMPARVLAVADVVEAMASYRPYRPALGLPAAIAELTEHREKYDPAVAAACTRLYEQGRLDL